MGQAMKAFGIIMFLVGLFLVLSRGKETTSIIGTISSNALKGIGVLQGRETNKITI